MAYRERERVKTVQLPSVIAYDIEEAHFRRHVRSVLAVADLFREGDELHFVLVRDV